MTDTEGGKSPEEQRPVQLAPEGVGPLLERDYIAVLAGTDCTPERVMEIIRSDFPSFSPDALAKFTRTDGKTTPLTVGDTMHVRIPGGGESAVIVTQLDARSMTVRTMEGHMEAGRNTFGSYYDEQGRLVVHVRSRSRISDMKRYVMYRLGGIFAQTSVWVTFIKRVAEACGAEIVDGVDTDTREVPDSAADAGEVEAPTFSPWRNEAA